MLLRSRGDCWKRRETEAKTIIYCVIIHRWERSSGELELKLPSIIENVAITNHRLTSNFAKHQRAGQIPCILIRQAFPIVGCSKEMFDIFASLTFNESIKPKTTIIEIQLVWQTPISINFLLGPLRSSASRDSQSGCIPNEPRTSTISSNCFIVPPSI